MIFRASIVLGMAALCLQPICAQTTKGWVSLFDGRSLSGWSSEGQAKWEVRSGVIISDTSGDGWLRSDKQYTNFVLRCDFRNSPKGNSGIFLRATKESKPGEPNPLGGYELQINNEDEKWATGSIEDVIQRLAVVNPAPDQWHTYEVELQGDHITAKLDGVKTLDGHDSQFKSGFLGLQHHKAMRTEFRNLQIRELVGGAK